MAYISHAHGNRAERLDLNEAAPSDVAALPSVETASGPVGAPMGALRFPFVVPRLPSTERIAHYLQASRAAGHFSNFGPNNDAFEAAVQARHAPGFGVSACTSCTAGLTAALLALGVTRPVLIPAFTFRATDSAVRAAGLQPVVADVDPATGILAAAAVAPAVRHAGIGAVLAIRPYGLWTDLSELAAACRGAGVPLVIDNASGFGIAPETAIRHAVPDAVEVFSLHATKPAAIGEGGLMLYPPPLHAAVRAALNFGMDPGTARARGPGLNGKLDEVRAAVARAMLEDLPARVRQRQRMAATLGRLALGAGIEPFATPGEEWRAPWHCFPVLLSPQLDTAAVAAACLHAGLQVRRYYYPAMAGVAGALVSATPVCATPVSAALAARAVCLPIYDGDRANDADAVWQTFAAALAHAG